MYIIGKIEIVDYYTKYLILILKKKKKIFAPLFKYFQIFTLLAISLKYISIMIAYFKNYTNGVKK